MILEFKKITNIVVIIIGALLFVFVVTAEYKRIQSNRHLPSLKYFLSTRHRRPATMADVIYISPWMTFDYINKIFSLPPEYLQHLLQIRNPKYPALIIDQYAKEENADPNLLIQEIQNSVRAYLMPSRPK